MASVPLAQFLNRAYVSHEHQRQLCARNDRRRVTGVLTGCLRNPSVHSCGRVRIRFLFRDYPALQRADELCETLREVRGVYAPRGYRVDTESDGEGFTVTLDWREA